MTFASEKWNSDAEIHILIKQFASVMQGFKFSDIIQTLQTSYILQQVEEYLISSDWHYPDITDIILIFHTNRELHAFFLKNKLKKLWTTSVTWASQANLC